MREPFDIDREVPQPEGSAFNRVCFCLDQLERYGADWNGSINERLTIEEVIGALVSAEQYIKINENDNA